MCVCVCVPLKDPSNQEKSASSCAVITGSILVNRPAGALENPAGGGVGKKKKKKLCDVGPFLRKRRMRGTRSKERERDGGYRCAD